MNLKIILWEYFVNLMELVLFYAFIQLRLHSSKETKKIKSKKFLFLLFHFVVISTLNYLEATTLLKISISCTLDILFSILFYQGTYFIRLFWSILYSVICIISEYIPFFILKVFTNFQFTEILFNGTLRIPFTAMYLALIAIFVFLLSLLSNNEIIFSPLQRIIYFLISITGILIGHFILSVTLESEQLFSNASFTFRLVLVNMFFILLFLSLLFYIYLLGILTAKNNRLLQDQKIYELEEQNYQNLIRTASSLREMKHDIKIHLNTIQSLAISKDIASLLAYIDSYHHSLSTTEQLISTNNTAINCILSEKINTATKKGIDTNYSIILPDQFPLDNLSLSSLLGNLWNNAIEANLRMIKQNISKAMYINFYIKPYNEMVVIHIENSYDGVIKYSSNNSFLSCKPGTEHGIGIKRIKDIVKQANGIIQFQAENYLFIVHILIPQKELSDENKNYYT